MLLVAVASDSFFCAYQPELSADAMHNLCCSQHGKRKQIRPRTTARKANSTLNRRAGL